jgi:hypothetical protein
MHAPAESTLHAKSKHRASNIAPKWKTESKKVENFPRTSLRTCVLMVIACKLLLQYFPQAEQVHSLREIKIHLRSAESLEAMGWMM